MRWPIRNQIFVPFAALLVVSVVLVALVAARNAADQSRQQKLSHMHTVTSALGDASFPLTQDVAERIAAMIGGEVIVAEPSGRITASTLQLETLPPELAELKEVTEEVTHTVLLTGKEYFVTVIPRFRVQRPGPLFVLLEQDDLQTLQRNAILPVLIVAVPTVLVALVVAMLISNGFASRVGRLKLLFAKLSVGQHPTVETVGRNDEFNDLLHSANELSSRLKHLQEELLRSERLELLGQLSGGLAHQLRNSITGARLAVQLHQQDCSTDKNELLCTAMSQLRLTEEQVLAVLSLRDGNTTQPEPQVASLSEMVDDVCHLLRPHCIHWHADLGVVAPPGQVYVRLNAPAAIKGAILNLVLNAVEAAGTEGTVRVDVSTEGSTAAIEIRDNGPGFREESDTLSDAFRTTKPEGVGLGLTIAQHAVAQENGQLTIGSEDGWTVVRVDLLDVVIRVEDKVSA